MKFILKPSLERFALVKIVAALWNKNDIDSMSKLYSQFSPSDLWESVAVNVVQKAGWLVVQDKVIKKVEWQEIEDRVIEKASQLPVPDLLKKKIEGCIRPMGLQIFKLMVYDCESHLFVNLPVELHWTSHGLIDRRKTAEKLIENENVDIAVRFKLACMFCLENYILELWNKMSVNIRESLSYTGVGIYNFWRNKLQGNSHLINYHSLSNQSLFKLNARESNAAAEYFLLKLAPREREQSLVRIAKEIECADVLCFLLSQMNDEQQIEVFKHTPYKVLRCFLYWPFQSFFIEAADHMWSFVPLCIYSSILLNIVSNIKLGYKDCDYKKIFEEFWLKSPSDFKRYILDDESYWPLLRSLLQIKDKKNFKLIIPDMSLIKKKKIIDWNEMEDICICLFFEGDWDMLGFIIENCLPSECDMRNFKNKFESKKSVKSYLRLAENKENWDQLFPFSDESVCTNTKRKCTVDKREVKKHRHIKKHR